MRNAANQLGLSLTVAVLAVAAQAGVMGDARAEQANPHAVAVIVGNRDYVNERVPAVAYAHRDAEAFRRFVLDVLGFDPNRVFDLRDATQAEMFTWFGNRDSHEGRLWRYLHPTRGSDVVVFYSGHGVPGLKDRRGYLLPSDADPDTPEINGYPIDLLYANLGAPREARTVRVFLDACFSGESERGMLIRSASPVVVVPDLPEASGEKLTVLTAASGKDVASWDEEARHGMFTHYLLDALYGQGDLDGDGEVTAVEAKAYLDDTMTIAARVAYGRHQYASLNGRTGAVLAGAREGGGFPTRPALDVDVKAEEDALGLTGEDRILVQRGLVSLGHDIGEIDGVLSPRTRSGIAAHQRAAGLAGTGYLTAELFAALKSRGGKGDPVVPDSDRDPKYKVARDKYLLGVELAFESKDYPKVLEYVRRIEELGGDLPSIVVYYRGEASFHAGRPGEAVHFLNRYVAEAGRDGEHYRRALGLLLELDDRDDAAYARAESAGTEAAFGEYLASFPDGLHATRASRKRAEAAAREAEQERRADDAAFSEARRLHTPASYGAYLERGGRHESEARSLLAELLRPGRKFRDCEACPELVVVSSGSYEMGSPPSEEGRYGDEGPVRGVTLLEAFAVGVYEVTFREWDACHGDGGCTHNPDDRGWGRGDRPVIEVSWEDAQEYVVWLSGETDEGYRLLSESEWEYVARGGTTGPFHTGTTITPEQANYDGNYTYGSGRKGRYRARTVPVGTFSSNGFGLHEVHGNVWEWVEDCWHGRYRGAPSDGSAWTAGGDCGRRVLRGGSWDDEPRNLRSAYRGGVVSGDRRDGVGFRIARTLD